MTHSRKLAAVPAAALLLSCGGALPGVPGSGGLSGGGEIGAECTGDWGSGEAALKLESFMVATSDFIGAAADIETGIKDACLDMGRELGIPDGELQGSGEVPQVKAACDAVSAKLRAEFGELSAQASLKIGVVATPPVCEVSVDAYAECVGSCEAHVDAGKVDVQCEGGELRGKCSGECRGSCSVEARAECSGSCEGTCTAGCKGTCNGRCDGKCSAVGPNGECQGRCDGKCEGTCSAQCEGSCEGQCVAEASGGCQGECRGECSVEFEAPQCTGEVRPPSASAECQASCDAKLDARAECTPGQAVLTVEGEVSGNLEDRVGKLRNVIESGLPVVRALGAKVRRLGKTGGQMVATADGLGGAVASLGLKAGQCVTRAAAALPRATAQVSVSVEVSASLTASAGAG